MPKFRKKPVVVEAMQFTRHNYPEVIAWIESYTGHPEMAHSPGGTLEMIIPTLEGDHRANPTDWIIRGVRGEFYPCRSDIFRDTYEPV
jgi:hypothetical protein